MDIFTAELIGTAILILLGDGVVAGGDLDLRRLDGLAQGGLRRGVRAAGPFHKDKNEQNENGYCRQPVEYRLALALELLFNAGQAFIYLLLKRVNVDLFFRGGRGRGLELFKASLFSCHYSKKLQIPGPRALYNRGGRDFSKRANLA